MEIIKYDFDANVSYVDKQLYVTGFEKSRLPRTIINL